MPISSVYSSYRRNEQEATPKQNDRPARRVRDGVTTIENAKFATIKPIRVYPKSPLAHGTGPFFASACIDQTGKE